MSTTALLLAACALTEPRADGAPVPAEAPAPPTPTPWHQAYPDVATALAKVTAANPRVIGVGELHATTDGPAVPSTLSRFTKDVLPVLAPCTTDLVIETWRLDGTCGAQEEQVATKVESDTKRPVETKSELVLLVEAATALNVRPHDLALTCDEYRTLQGPDGEVVYDALLKLLAGKLGEYAQRGLATPDASLVIYGGAVHNDAYPREGLEAWSYGAAAHAKGGYVELDLYQPELVGDAMKEPAWAPLLAEAGPDHVVLIERAEGSFVLLLPTAH